MKGVFVILDGVADLPCSQLGDKSPLEAAQTPNLDEIAKRAKIRHCYTVKEGVAPESSSAVLSLLGYDPNFVSRGPLEAKGIGIKLKNGDLAFRCNFATIDNLEDLNILDRRAGRTLTTEEAKILAKAINENVKLPFKFEFYQSIQHRGVLIIRGGFSDNISNIDPAYGAGAVFGTEGKLNFSKPLDDEDDSKLSAELVNNFVRRSFSVLDKHPVNIARVKKGLCSANIILCRDAGSSLPKLKKLPGKWIGLGYMPLEIGIGESSGMSVYKFKYPKLKGIDSYGNLYEGLDDAIKYAKKMLWWDKNKYDYFYIHFKETDIPGHDNKPLDKVKMIEIIDKDFFSYLKKFVGNSKLIVTADHTTACRKKAHTADPVPVLVYPSDKESVKRFTESEGMKGRKISGRNLLKSVFFGKRT
ncbi:2,3-bisphosphoglycerate-independent phosphoglycerate mutase [Candidatus Pacearchaeota archaeon]|nr:2,3-bisphosphoglycerate-independent phosphoglycerate mutase [Candidatus Pacearchaeota archaeon]